MHNSLYHRLYFGISVALLLSACGSENSNAPEPPKDIPLEASSSFKILASEQAQIVDMRALVSGHGVALTRLHSDMVGCDASIEGDLRVRVEQPYGQFCHYQYQAKDAKGKTASASLNLYSTAAEHASLPVRAHAMLKGGVIHDFDLKQLLGNKLPNGYTLVADSLQVLGDVDNVGSVSSPQSNVIRFTSPDAIGWNRILFSVQNETDNTQQMLGSIYVTFADELNAAPVIAPVNYDYNIGMSATVKTRQTIDLDLASLTGLTITDTQAWQLIEATSMSANVEVVEPNSTTNKRLRFTATEPGEHTISYMVADELGAVSRGMIAVTVTVQDQAVNWPNVYVEGTTYKNTFVAPALYNAIVEQVSVAALWDEAANNTLAGFSAEQAEFYCQSIGLVPTSSELFRAYSLDGSSGVDSGTFAEWPKAYPYLVRQDSGVGYQTFDLTTGQVGNYESGERAYLSCVNYSELEIEMLRNAVVANNQAQPVLVIKKPLELDSYVVEAVAIDADTPLPEVAISQEDGVDQTVVVSINGVQSGALRLRVTNETNPAESLISGSVVMTADSSTAQLAYTFSKSPDSLSQDKLIADGEDVLTANVTINDINDNPIQDYLTPYVVAVNKADLQTPEAQLLTRADGTFDMRFTSPESTISGNEVEVQHEFDLMVGGQPHRISLNVVGVNYFSTIELTILGEHRLYSRAKIRVLDSDGQPRAAKVDIAGGVQGSIIHIDGSAYVTEIDVPVEGQEVIMSMSLDNTPGEIEFRLMGSSYRPSLTTPSVQRTRVNYMIAYDVPYVTDEDKEANREYYKRLLADNDSMCIERRSATVHAHVYLPRLGPEDIGRTIALSLQLGRKSIVAYRLDGERYTIDKGLPRGVLYWDGKDWSATNESLIPAFVRCHELGGEVAQVTPAP